MTMPLPKLTPEALRNNLLGVCGHVIEMLRFPSPEDRGEGVITEILGPRGQPGVDTLSIIRAYNLPDEFPGALPIEVQPDDVPSEQECRQANGNVGPGSPLSHGCIPQLFAISRRRRDR